MLFTSTGMLKAWGGNESVLGVNPRNPMNIWRIRKVLKELSHQSSDGLIVHVHLTWPFFYATLASLGLPGIKLIYTEHNTTSRRRNIPMVWLLECLLYARYACIICISDGVHTALAEWVGPKIAQRLVTVSNGSRIYSLAQRPALEGRLPRLVSVGSLSTRKNFATAIRAIGKLKHEIHSYTIIGEGAERASLEKIIVRENLVGKVRLVGWSEAIESYLHASDIQVIPSLTEGFGLVAVEGMSTGLPVVASDVAGLREVLDPSNPAVVFVSKIDSVQDWVAGIRESIAVVSNKGSETLGQFSRQQAEKFTLKKMADRYLLVYRHL